MIEGPVLPIQSAKCLSGTSAEISEYLQRHGCTVSASTDYDLVTFPEGTTEQEIFPRTFESRYRITLPDGTTCYRQCLRARIDYRQNTLSILLFSNEVINA